MGVFGAAPSVVFCIQLKSMCFAKQQKSGSNYPDDPYYRQPHGAAKIYKGVSGNVRPADDCGILGCKRQRKDRETAMHAIEMIASRAANFCFIKALLYLN